MEMQKFEVKGACQMGETRQAFTKVVEAPNEKVAKEHVYADIGSKHNLKRRYISIDGVTVVGD